MGKRKKRKKRRKKKKKKIPILGFFKKISKDVKRKTAKMTSPKNFFTEIGKIGKSAVMGSRAIQKWGADASSNIAKFGAASLSNVGKFGAASLSNVGKFAQSTLANLGKAAGGVLAPIGNFIKKAGSKAIIIIIVIVAIVAALVGVGFYIKKTIAKKALAQVIPR